MADNFTPADWAAMNGSKDGIFGGGGFFGIIVLFFIFAMFGGGFGGGFGFGNNAATQGALTRAELADGFNTAEIQRNQSDLMRDNFNLQNAVLENRFATQQSACATQNAVMQNRYDNAVGMAGITKDIMQNRYDNQLAMQNLQAQMASCCCDLKSAVLADGAATRELIQSNYISTLKDELDTARNAVANAVQTGNILNSIGRFVAYPGVSPSTCYGNCGCGC